MTRRTLYPAIRQPEATDRGVTPAHSMLHSYR